jgi:hypothetical protein
MIKGSRNSRGASYRDAFALEHANPFLARYAIRMHAVGEREGGRLSAVLALDARHQM